MGLGGWENRCAIDSLQRGKNRGEQTENGKRCGVYRRLNTVLSTGWAGGCSLFHVPHALTQVGFALSSLKTDSSPRKQKHIFPLACSAVYPCRFFFGVICRVLEITAVSPIIII